MFVNLTKHEIHLKTEDGGEIVLPPSKKEARVRMRTSVQGTHLGVPVVGQPMSSGLENLPDIDKDGEFKLYIVSRVVKDAVPDRYDVVVPNDLVRDKDGNILYCKSVSL